MSKLSPLPFLKVREILMNSGFRLDRVKGSHFTYKHSTNEREVTVPRKSKDIPVGTLKSIIRQSGLSRSLFTR